MNSCAARAAVLVFAATAAVASAEPAVTTTTRYYDVTGTTPAEIRVDLNRRRPHGWDGLTRSHVSWNFRLEPGSGDCRMTSVTTRVEVDYLLPRWLDPGRASPETRAQWERYERALKIHEDGHRDIGIGAAREIEKTLRGLTGRTCPELERDANDTAQRLLEEARERERDYDRMTNYGATQGARFP